MARRVTSDVVDFKRKGRKFNLFIGISMVLQHPYLENKVISFENGLVIVSPAKEILENQDLPSHLAKIQPCGWFSCALDGEKVSRT